MKKRTRKKVVFDHHSDLGKGQSQVYTCQKIFPIHIDYNCQCLKTGGETDKHPLFKVHLIINNLFSCVKIIQNMIGKYPQEYYCNKRNELFVKSFYISLLEIS